MKKLRNPFIILAGQILIAGVVALASSQLGNYKGALFPADAEAIGKSLDQVSATVSPTLNSDAFHFLEPLAPRAGNPENFDPSLLNYLSVEICRVSQSDCAVVKTFTSQGAGSDQLRIETVPRAGSYYIANWSSQNTNRETYRIIVMLAGLQLGAVDLTPDVYNTFGRTWPIKFLVEKDPVLRVRLLRLLGRSCSQIASVLKNEFNFSAEETASLLAYDPVPCSATEIEIAIRGVYQAAVIPNTTKISDEATRNALLSFDPATGRMVFAARTALLNSLRVGNVLVSEPGGAAPNGYLRKVTRIENGGLVLQTTQARLDEAIQQGTLVAMGQLLPSDLITTQAHLPGVSSSTVTRTSGDMNTAAGVIGDDYDFQTHVDITLTAAASGDGVNGDGFVRIEGDIRYNAGYNVNTGIEACIDVPPVCVDRFEASVGVDQYSTLRVSGEFNGTLDKEVKLTTHYFKPIVFFIGPVPVVIVPVIDVVVGVHGDAHLRFSFAAEVSTQLLLGARWTDPDNDGVGWEDLSHKNGVQAGVTEQDFDANMKLRGYGKADAKLLFYGVAGPGFASRIGGGMDVQVPRKPVWKIFGYIGASFNFQVDLGGILKLDEYSKNVLDEEFMIAQAQNLAPRFSNVKTDVIQVDVGKLVTLGPRAGFNGYFDVTDLEGDSFTLTAVSNVDGLLPSLTYAFQTSGLRTIVVTARDSEGATSSITLTVNVNNTPPIVTLTAPNTIPATVQYFATATAYDWETGSLSCSSLFWQVNVPHTINRNGTCAATITFLQEGPATVTVMATDPNGGVGSNSVSVVVTRAPLNRPPIIDEDSFSIKAIPRPGVVATGCNILNQRCDVPDGALLYNGQSGDYTLPLYMHLNASDPEGDPVTITWVCQSGILQAVVTDVGFGVYSCRPWNSNPITVRAYVSDGVNPPVSSWVRNYTMDPPVN